MGLWLPLWLKNMVCRLGFCLCASLSVGRSWMCSGYMIWRILVILSLEGLHFDEIFLKVVCFWWDHINRWFYVSRLSFGSLHMAVATMFDWLYMLEDSDCTSVGYCNSFWCLQVCTSAFSRYLTSARMLMQVSGWSWASVGFDFHGFFGSACGSAHLWHWWGWSKSNSPWFLGRMYRGVWMNPFRRWMGGGRSRWCWGDMRACYD